MSQIVAIISVVRELIALIKLFLNWRDQQRSAEAESRRQDREQAIKDAQNAKTPEEAFDAQERIVRNQPRP